MKTRDFAIPKIAVLLSKARDSGPLRFVRLVCWIAASIWLQAAVGTAQAEDLKKPETPRAMFRALGVDDQCFEKFVDDRPLDPDGTESMLRILFRLRTFPAVDVERWALAQDKLKEAIGEPGPSRGQIFRLRGRVVEIAPLTPSDDDAQRFEMTRYFRCQIVLDGLDRPVDVYTEHVPMQWQGGGEPDVLGGALGVFLKVAEKSDGRPLILFAAPRLAWYPDTLLGQLGMDVGLLDSVENQQPITAGDREAFYQMLAAAGRAKPGQLLQAAEDVLPHIQEDWQWTDRQDRVQYSVAPLFNEAATQTGRLVELLGAARRVDEIRLDKVEDADIIARFGFDHYYMISLFTDDSQGNPVTFCVLELPEGMPYGNVPRYGETVRVAGFFFKTWRYGVTQLVGAPKAPSQLSPLLIGRSLTWYPATKPAADPYSGVAVGALFALVMVVVWLVAWRNSRRDRRWIDRMESQPAAGGGLDRIAAPADDKPDFSHIADMDHGKRPPSDNE